MVFMYSMHYMVAWSFLCVFYNYVFLYEFQNISVQALKEEVQELKNKVENDREEYSKLYNVCEELRSQVEAENMVCVLCVCVLVCACVFVCVCMLSCMYVRTYVCAYVILCVSMYLHIQVYVHKVT